jgi:tRNA dimethylallyltransferase
MSPNVEKCVAIMGATATGKSELGIELAQRLGGEIISMDSRQVYRGMDIGTGKVTREQRNLVPHHLLDILDPHQLNSAGQHAALARQAIVDISDRGITAFLAGGTGLYFDALYNPLIDVSIPPAQRESIHAAFNGLETEQLYEELRGVDPKRAAELSPNDRLRITRALEVFMATGTPQSEHFKEQGKRAGEYDFLKIVLTMPREMLRDRIAKRTRAMFAAGWVDEVRGLLEAGYSVEAPGMNSLGYRDIAEAIIEGVDPSDTVDTVQTLTQQYAKRQETFFRKDSEATWIDVTQRGFIERVEGMVRAFLQP